MDIYENYVGMARGAKEKYDMSLLHSSRELIKSWRLMYSIISNLKRDKRSFVMKVIRRVINVLETGKKKFDDLELSIESYIKGDIDRKTLGGKTLSCVSFFEKFEEIAALL